MASKRKRATKKRKHGEGAIYDTPNGTKIVQIRINEELIRRRSPDQQTTEALLAELNEQKRSGICSRCLAVIGSMPSNRSMYSDF